MRVLDFFFNFPVWTVPAPSPDFLPLVVLPSNVDVPIFEYDKCAVLDFANMLGAGLSPRRKFLDSRSGAGQSFIKKRLPEAAAPRNCATLIRV
jgi:hypothetical protein